MALPYALLSKLVNNKIMAKNKLLKPLSYGSLIAALGLASSAMAAITPNAEARQTQTTLMAASNKSIITQEEVAPPLIDMENPAVEAAVNFTRDLTDRANAAFTATTDSNLQLTNFQTVLTEGLALDFLGRFMLGSRHKDLTPSQRTRYETVFPEYITRLYAEQFKDIAGKQLDINEAAPFGRRDVIVRTQFMRDDGTPVNVDWRARKLRDDGHKMIDIIVSGVSIMTVKREEFSGFIETNGVEALITRLELEIQD